MTTLQKTKLAENIKTLSIVISLIFACVTGWAMLKADVQQNTEHVAEIRTELKPLSKAVTELNVEVENLNKTVEKIEKKL